MDIINGREIRNKILEGLREKIEKLPLKPIFSDVLVGQDAASQQYVKMKEKTATNIGIEFLKAQFDESITTEELLIEIDKLNATPRMCGLIVQLPLPSHIDTKKVLDRIDPSIDVDATGEINTKKFYEGNPGFIFPTAQAVMEIISSLDVDFKNKNFVILGKGDLVGKPVNKMLINIGIIPIVVDRTTLDISSVTRKADVLICATGRGGLIDSTMLKEGVIIIDAGTSESYGSIVGDVNTLGIEAFASALSPVPGGVGPVTVACLMRNIVLSAQNKFNAKY